MCAIGLDCGTMWLVKSSVDQIAKGTLYSIERNCFLELADTPDTEEMLKENNWSYAKHEGKYYILGDDAIKLKNMLTVNVSSDNQGIVATKVGDLRRPMKDGILNTSGEKLSVAIIQKLIGSLIGKPSHDQECLCFCAPGDPVDNALSVVFHKTMLGNYLKTLGYRIECIPEALAIIFSERPVADDPDEDGGEAPFSGISFSFGAGMANICFAWKKMPLINFSVARSGDWIDKESARTAGCIISAITRFKESKLDLSNIDYTDMRQAALSIYYENMIEHALNNFSEKFNSLDNRIDSPLEIVIAGGTASVTGFLDKFKSVLDGLELPFEVKSVRMADNPLYSVANGCLIKAMSTEKKSRSIGKTVIQKENQAAKK